MRLRHRRVMATARRVLLQLPRDRRTIGLLLIVRSILLILVRFVFDGRPQVFDQFAPMLLALTPFTVMFEITSVAMLRERTTGTIERVLTTPGTEADLLMGYAVAFGAAGVAQVGLVLAVSLDPLGLHLVAGSAPLLVVVAVLDALAGMALGLFSAPLRARSFRRCSSCPSSCRNCWWPAF